MAEEEFNGLNIKARYLTDVGEMSAQEFAEYCARKYPTPIASLRDQFAMSALTGIVHIIQTEGQYATNAKTAAKMAFEYADAMIAERNKK